jgi:hypothetical protein
MDKLQEPSLYHHFREMCCFHPQVTGGECEKNGTDIGRGSTDSVAVSEPAEYEERRKDVNF